MEKLVVDRLKRYRLQIGLCILNIIVLVFIVVYAFVSSGGVAASVFSGIMIATFCADILYFALSKRKFSLLAIGVILTLFAINTASMLVIGLSVFQNSTSILGIAALALIPISAIGFGVLQLTDNKKQRQKAIPVFMRFLFWALCVGGLTAVAAVGIVMLCGISAINTNVVNLTAILTVFCVALFALSFSALRAVGMTKLRKSIFVVIAGIMLSVALVPLMLSEGAAIADNNRNSKQFITAFGEGSASQTNELRNAAYCYADVFYGVVTTDYKIKRDILYYTGTEGMDTGLTLRYDMYYPTYEGAHKAVLLNIHGSGGDKDTGNYAHRNKYFASRGYVVFDLQIGDYNEKDITSFSLVSTSESMLLHIDQFFRFAVTNNEIGADFGQIFMTGVSMGGGLVAKYAYSYPNCLKEIGAKLKGIIPVYPGYAYGDRGIDNYLNYVTSESAPCLLVMSLSDVIVNRYVVDAARKAFSDVGNGYFASVGISYAGHGSDGLLSGRFNQSYMYYAERFMDILRV